jgi:hypothetical protein
LPALLLLRKSSAIRPSPKRLTVAVKRRPFSSKLKFSLCRRLGRRWRCAARLRSWRVSPQISSGIYSCGRVAEGVFSFWIVPPSRSAFGAPRSSQVAGLVHSGSGGPVRLDSPLKSSLLSKTPFGPVGQTKSCCCPEMAKWLCKNSKRYHRTRNFEPCGHAQSKKTVVMRRAKKRKDLSSAQH